FLALLDSSVLYFFFFLMIRPPPRSTLFPYHDALPICERILRRHRSEEHPHAASLREADHAANVRERRKNLRVSRHIDVVGAFVRSEEHTSELQSRRDLVCRLLLEKKKKKCSLDYFIYN